MPLKSGSSNATREANIKAEIRAGKRPAQAVAIGYSEQRRAKGKHMGEKKKGKSHGITQGHHGESSEGMGTDGGAPGSHEGKEQRHHIPANQRINTGHPSELESFDEGSE
jgi:hypothetical protein